MGFSLPAPDPDPGDFAAGAFAQYPHGGQASWRFLHRVWPRFDQSFESKKHVAEMLQLWPWPNSYNWEYVMIYNQLVIGVRIPVITVKGHNFSFFPVFFLGGHMVWRLERGQWWTARFCSIPWFLKHIRRGMRGLGVEDSHQLARKSSMAWTSMNEYWNPCWLWGCTILGNPPYNYL
jgi:hypothetical protein